MPQSSSVFKQTEELLEEVLRIIREECENPSCVLGESDRKKFVDEEEILSKQLKETIESESNNRQWWRLTSWPSRQAEKCLKDAQELHQRVKEHRNENLRTMLTGKSNPPPSPSDRQGLAFNPMMDTRSPETDTGRPLADASLELPSATITSPLNMRCSSPEVSELIVYPAVQNDNNYMSDLDESINTPHEMSSNRSDDSSSRSVQSSDLFLSSETTTNPGSGSSARPSHSVRRSAAPSPQLTRQLRTPGSPINGSFPSPTPLFPNPAMTSSVSGGAEQVDNFVSSVVKEGISRQAQARRGLRHNEDYATNINCVDNIGSDVVGLTLNNGGSNNSGAAIHMVSPSGLPQPVSRF